MRARRHAGTSNGKSVAAVAAAAASSSADPASRTAMSAAHVAGQATVSLFRIRNLTGSPLRFWAVSSPLGPAAAEAAAEAAAAELGMGAGAGAGAGAGERVQELLPGAERLLVLRQHLAGHGLGAGRRRRRGAGAGAGSAAGAGVGAGAGSTRDGRGNRQRLNAAVLATLGASAQSANRYTSAGAGSAGVGGRDGHRHKRLELPVGVSTIIELSASDSDSDDAPYYPHYPRHPHAHAHAHAHSHRHGHGHGYAAGYPSSSGVPPPSGLLSSRQGGRCADAHFPHPTADGARHSLYRSPVVGLHLSCGGDWGAWAPLRHIPLEELTLPTAAAGAAARAAAGGWRGPASVFPLLPALERPGAVPPLTASSVVGEGDVLMTATDAAAAAAAAAAGGGAAGVPVPPGRAGEPPHAAAYRRRAAAAAASAAATAGASGRVPGHGGVSDGAGAGMGVGVGVSSDGLGIVSGEDYVVRPARVPLTSIACHLSTPQEGDDEDAAALRRILAAGGAGGLAATAKTLVISSTVAVTNATLLPIELLVLDTASRMPLFRCLIPPAASQPLPLLVGAPDEVQIFTRPAAGAFLGEVWAWPEEGLSFAATRAAAADTKDAAVPAYLSCRTEGAAAAEAAAAAAAATKAARSNASHANLGGVSDDSDDDDDDEATEAILAGASHSAAPRFCARLTVLRQRQSAGSSVLARGLLGSAAYLPAASPASSRSGDAADSAADSAADLLSICIEPPLVVRNTLPVPAVVRLTHRTLCPEALGSTAAAARAAVAAAPLAQLYKQTGTTVVTLEHGQAAHVHTMDLSPLPTATSSRSSRAHHPPSTAAAAAAAASLGVAAPTAVVTAELCLARSARAASAAQARLRAELFLALRELAAAGALPQPPALTAAGRSRRSGDDGSSDRGMSTRESGGVDGWAAASDVIARSMLSLSGQQGQAAAVAAVAGGNRGAADPARWQGHHPYTSTSGTSSSSNSYSSSR